MDNHTEEAGFGLGASGTERICSLHNYLLAALPPSERERLLTASHQIYLPPGSVLYEPGDTPHHLYFPSNCIVSLLHGLRDGASAGIATIGNEGVVGMEALTGGDTMMHRAVVHSGGFACRLTASQLKEELPRRGELLRRLLQYTQLLFAQVAQNVVCNTHHSVDQRLCRWLLASLDRVSSSELTMTHDLIANILGARREGITVAAQSLQRHGVINYRRGRITVLDRSRLEKLSCECYGVVRNETDRLLPRVPRPSP